MSSFFEQVGLGACFACLGLPLLAAALGDVSKRDARSRHWALMGPFVFALSLFAVPWLREVFRFRPEVTVASGSVFASAVTLSSVGHEASSWSWLELVGAGYLGLVLFAALRYLVRWVRLQRALLGAEAADESLQAEVSARARLVGVSAPMVLVSGAVAVPFVAGALWPSLVWPAGLLAQLTPEQRGLVIQHELSHLSRGDHRVGPVLSVFELAFPFHPTASRLMRELALAREEAVDQRIEPEQLHAYAQLLVTVKAQSLGALPLEVLGMADASLARRIEALTVAQRLPAVRGGRLVALGVALFSALVFAPTAVAEEHREIVEVTVAGVDELVGTDSKVLRVAVGDPSIAAVRVAKPNQLAVSGLAAGTTSVKVWVSSGKVETFEVSVRPNVSGEQVVTVELGKKTTVKVNGLTRAAIGNESVCEMNVRGDGVLELKGRSSGSTTLLTWDTNGQRREFLVRVVAK